MCSNCRTEKCDQRGVNGSLRKLSQSKTSAQDPKAHPNPRVLGVVQNSYRRATRTLKTLGTSEIEHGSKHTKSARKQHGILSPVEPTYTTWVRRSIRWYRAGSRWTASAGWSDARFWTASVQPTPCTGWSDKINDKHRCSCPEKLQNVACRLPVHPMLRKVKTPVKRAKTAHTQATPVDPTLMKTEAPVRSTDTPKTLSTEPCRHQLIRRPWTQASVQPVQSRNRV